jgi:hypothetical protein
VNLMVSIHAQMSDGKTRSDMGWLLESRMRAQEERYQDDLTPCELSSYSELRFQTSHYRHGVSFVQDV